MTTKQLNHNNMMTKYTKTIGALAATTMLMGGYAAAELEGEINVGYTNMYEFRFVDLGQDLVSAGADVAYGFGDGWAGSAMLPGRVSASSLCRATWGTFFTRPDRPFGAGLAVDSPTQICRYD